MKVIKIDNFGRESISDVLIKDNLTQEEAKLLQSELQPYNNKSKDLYVVVEDDYKLYEFDY